jgi:hypothetical protein
MTESRDLDALCAEVCFLAVGSITILRIEDDACTAARPAAHPADLWRDEVDRVQADVLGIAEGQISGNYQWLISPQLVRQAGSQTKLH